MEGDHGRQVQAAIDAKAVAWRESRGGIGILEQIDALGQLSAGNAAVTVAQWVLLLVLIDCLPVLTKWFGGVNAYDRMIRRRIDSRVERHEERVHHEELRASAEVRARTAELTRDSRAKLAEDAASSHRQLEAELDRLTEAFHAGLR